MNSVDVWTEFLMAYILIFEEGTRTLAMGLYSLYASMPYSQNWVGLVICTNTVIGATAGVNQHSNSAGPLLLLLRVATSPQPFTLQI